MHVVLSLILAVGIQDSKAKLTVFMLFPSYGIGI
jgi:hypothetical protein